MQNNLSIESINYSNTKHRRVIKSCLEKWFSDPKDLHLTAPTIKYPFNFNNWIKTSYTKSITRSYVLKDDGWIIGYMSLQFQPDNSYIHLFHVYIDREYREKGYSSLLLKKAEAIAVKNKIPIITLFVNMENSKAIAIYERSGFKKVEKTKRNSYKMAKFIG
ncbi:GNAT family N-acetyltransferase [Candidatus Neomarinimicrobiota bacterium]